MFAGLVTSVALATYWAYRERTKAVGVPSEPICKPRQPTAPVAPAPTVPSMVTQLSRLWTLPTTHSEKHAAHHNAELRNALIHWLPTDPQKAKLCIHALSQALLDERTQSERNRVSVYHGCQFQHFLTFDITTLLVGLANQLPMDNFLCLRVLPATWDKVCVGEHPPTPGDEDLRRQFSDEREDYLSWGSKFSVDAENYHVCNEPILYTNLGLGGYFDNAARCSLAYFLNSEQQKDPQFSVEDVFERRGLSQVYQQLLPEIETLHTNFNNAAQSAATHGVLLQLSMPWDMLDTHVIPIDDGYGKQLHIIDGAPTYSARKFATALGGSPTSIAEPNKTNFGLILTPHETLVPKQNGLEVRMYHTADVAKWQAYLKAREDLRQKLQVALENQSKAR